MKAILIIASLLAVNLLSAADPGVIPIQVTKCIKLVYQVSDDKEHEGINRGLFYVRKLIDTYEREGISLSEVDFHVVYHGSGINALVNDTTRARLDPEHPRNPNAEAIASQNREPDFFELLKAAINLGSLAKSSENSFAAVNYLDAYPDHQIIQIGANLIDQYDADSFPTRIAFNTDFNPMPIFYGVENLPYLAQVYHTPYRFQDRPEDGKYERPIVGEWLQPVVWNPHTNPHGGPAATRPNQFRFVVTGRAFVLIRSQSGIENAGGNPGISRSWQQP